MSTKQPPHPSRFRSALSYLIAAGPLGDGTWRWRFTTFLALLGPGSVPFGLLLFANQNQVLRDGYGMDWAVLVALATGASVVLARWRPLQAWLLVMLSLIATILGANEIGWSPWPLSVPTAFALVVVLFALGRDRPIWKSSLCWLVYVLTAVWAMWSVNAQLLDIGPDPYSDPNPGVNNLTIGSLVGALALLVGFTVRIWRLGRARVAKEERVSEAERHQRKLLEERARIARELHDVVAHHMSVISVQASTAEYRIEGLSGEARAEFRAIGDQARESLAEMRRLLGVLRSEDEAGARAPQPGPDSLGSLVESVNRAGTPVTLEVGELPEELPETVALTVFRVVQEALSNVVRHAPGAATAVRVATIPAGADTAGRGAGKTAVRWSAAGRGAPRRSVTVTVVNGPPPGGADPARGSVPRGSGYGLVGMGERVALDGGALETGPTPEGGFRVHAVLPIATGPDASAAVRPTTGSTGPSTATTSTPSKPASTPEETP